MERDARTIEERLEGLKTRCRREGMNLTPQRTAVYRALLESRDHPTPEAVYAAVRRRLPSISQATIYKTLETLKRLGLVAEVSRLGEARRFEANLDHHHHLVCTRCGRVADYEDKRLDRLQIPRDLDGFVPTDVTVQILGRCGWCAASGEAGTDIEPTHKTRR